jgi:hypothetical protein
MVGDIAEVQMTGAAVPIRHDRFKMLVQLRSIALLDGSFTDARIQLKFKGSYSYVTKIIFRKQQPIDQRPTKSLKPCMSK